MKRYIVTIVNTRNNSVSQFERTLSDIDKLIEKELGGWNNLRGVGTSNEKIEDNFQRAGSVFHNDSYKLYSILEYEV